MMIRRQRFINRLSPEDFSSVQSSFFSDVKISPATIATGYSRSCLGKHQTKKSTQTTMTGIGRVTPRQAGYEIREINLSGRHNLHDTKSTTHFKNHAVDSLHVEKLPLASRLPTLFIIALGLTALVLLLRQKLLWQGVYALPIDQDLGF